MTAADLHINPSRDMLFIETKFMCPTGPNFSEVAKELRKVAIGGDPACYNYLAAGEDQNQNDNGRFPNLEHVFLTNQWTIEKMRERGYTVASFPLPPYHFDTRRITEDDEDYPHSDKIPYKAIKPLKFKLYDVQDFDRSQPLRDPTGHGVWPELTFQRGGQILSREEVLEVKSCIFDDTIQNSRRIWLGNQRARAKMYLTSFRRVFLHSLMRY